MEKEMKNSKIPHTDSIEELARFWDTHDLTDFDDQLVEVGEPVFEKKSDETLTIRLQREEIEAIKQIAESKGIEEVLLVREWVLEKLHQS
jgi:predicted DNA binding CopG/RHH family protein